LSFLGSATAAETREPGSVRLGHVRRGQVLSPNVDTKL
jgi:hypothetical protein